MSVFLSRWRLNALRRQWICYFFSCESFKYSDGGVHAFHNDIIKAHLYEWFIVIHIEKLWQPNESEKCGGWTHRYSLFTSTLHWCVVFLYVGLFLVYNIHVAHYGIHSTHQHSQTRNAHPFYLHCFGSKIKRMFVAAAACALFFLVCVHVSAHHFHPFYGFKINQKIRLELFCCIVFSTHYLFCCCYGVFFI